MIFAALRCSVQQREDRPQVSLLGGLRGSPLTPTPSHHILIFGGYGWGVLVHATTLVVFVFVFPKLRQ